MHQVILLVLVFCTAIPAQCMMVYREQCAACHGERGRGDGPAARFLDPAPRDFRSGYFRFVSTRNGIPTDGDLFEALSAGLPGSAMLPFGHLPPEQRSGLVEIIREFRRDGLREKLGSAISDPAALEAAVLEADMPGAVIQAPPETPDTVDSRAQGALHFTRLCSRCHGPEGRGIDDPTRLTAEGVMARPRDLTRGVLKGGVESARIWQRLRAGIPGTPMPAVPETELPDDAAWDLIHFVQSIIPRGAQELHENMMWPISVPRVEGKLPVVAEDPRFLAQRPVWVALAPFRSQPRTVEGIAVRALHDGELVALRIDYADSTMNLAGTDRTAPDGVAVRLSSSRSPPVLPIPGSPLPLDRALWLTGAKPAHDDPLFDNIVPKFVNPDSVCRSPIGPEHVGRGAWRDGVWTVLMVVRPERAGHVHGGESMPISFAVFDGNCAMGPLPAAFSHWQTLRFAK